MSNWTKAEYDAAPETVDRLHARILDLNAEVERLRAALTEADRLVGTWQYGKARRHMARALAASGEQAVVCPASGGHPTHRFYLDGYYTGKCSRCGALAASGEQA